MNMLSQLDTREYCEVGVTQDVDMTDAGSEQPGQAGVSSCAAQRAWILDVRDVEFTCPLASNNENLFALVGQYILATRNSVQGVISCLEHGAILGHLRIVRDVLNLGANRPFLDTRGPVYRNPPENEALCLLNIARDLSSNRPVWDHEGDLVVKYSPEYISALPHLHVAFYLMGKVAWRY